MQETVNDPYALKRLQRENIALMEELKLERERCGIARRLISLFTGDYTKELDGLREDLGMLRDDLIKFLKENRNLKGQLAELERLRSFIKDREEKLFILTKGQDWNKVAALNVCKSYRISAKILCYAAEGCTAEEIARNMSDGGIRVSLNRVNRALSVKGDEDLFRVNAVLHQFPDVFKEHGISEADVLKWFSETRIKKLKLLDKAEAEERFGAEVLDCMTPDPCVTGEYYDVRGMGNKQMMKA